jgi:hypothetical protein
MARHMTLMLMEEAFAGQHAQSQHRRAFVTNRTRPSSLSTVSRSSHVFRRAPPLIPITLYFASRLANEGRGSRRRTMARDSLSPRTDF